MNMQARRYAWVFSFIFSLLLLSGCKDRLFDNPLDPNAERTAYEVLATVQLNGIVPVDLAFSGDSLWVVDSQSRLLSLNYNSGAVIRELESESPPSGVCYDGDDLWITVRNSSQIVKLNIVTGTTIRVLTLTRGDFGPIDFSGSRLYITDRLTNSVLVVDPETGRIEKALSNPGFSLNGVAYDGVNLWTIDATQMKIFRLTASGSVLMSYQTPGRAGAGMSVGSGIMWTGDQTGKIFKLRFQ